MSGVEAVRLIRGHEAERSLRGCIVVAVTPTTIVSAEQEASFREAGMQGWVPDGWKIGINLERVLTRIIDRQAAGENCFVAFTNV